MICSASWEYVASYADSTSWGGEDTFKDVYAIFAVMESSHSRASFLHPSYEGLMLSDAYIFRNDTCYAAGEVDSKYVDRSSTWLDNPDLWVPWSGWNSSMFRGQQGMETVLLDGDANCAVDTKEGEAARQSRSLARQSVEWPSSSDPKVGAWLFQVQMAGQTKDPMGVSRSSTKPISDNSRWSLNPRAPLARLQEDLCSISCNVILQLLHQVEIMPACNI